MSLKTLLFVVLLVSLILAMATHHVVFWSFAIFAFCAFFGYVFYVHLR